MDAAPFGLDALRDTAADVVAGYGWTLRKLAWRAIEPREANALFLGLAGPTKK
jgi:hypothetical protein